MDRVCRVEIAAPADAHDWLEVDWGAINDLAIDEVKDVATIMSFHWHISGRHFRDDHMLLDEYPTQIFSMIDGIAERVRKIGGTALRSIAEITVTQF